MKFFVACILLCPVFAFADDVADATAVPSDVVVTQASTDAYGDCEAPADVTAYDASEDASVDLDASVKVCEDAEVCTAPEVAEAPTADVSEPAPDAASDASASDAGSSANVVEASKPKPPEFPSVPSTGVPLWLALVLGAVAVFSLVFALAKSVSDSAKSSESKKD